GVFGSSPVFPGAVPSAIATPMMIAAARPPPYSIHLRLLLGLACASRCSGVNPNSGSPLGPVYGRPMPTPPPTPVLLPPGPCGARRPRGSLAATTGGEGGSGPTVVGTRPVLSGRDEPLFGVTRTGALATGATESAS